MARKLKEKAIVQIKRSERGISITANNGFEWKVEKVAPDIAIATVLSVTLSKTIFYEDKFSKEYVIEMKIEHKHDE